MNAGDYDDEALRREMLQARILAGIFGDALGRRFRKHIALKGGLAMRLHHRSDRMTKDIDLESDGSFPVEAARKWVSGLIVRTARDMGIHDVAVTEPKQTETTQRWKVAYTSAAGIVSNLTVEMSRRGLPPPELLSDAAVGGPEGLGATATAYNPIGMAAAKVAALPRSAPRDTYDLFLLVRSQVRPGPEVLRRLGEDNLRSVQAQIWDVMGAMGYERARDELVPYLPRGARDSFTEEAWEAMKLEVGMEVEGWVREALGPR